MDERNESRKWRAAVADMNKQIEKVIEIGDIDLVEWVAAAILDCVIDFKEGRMPEASRAATMKLTAHFSRIRANSPPEKKGPKKIHYWLIVAISDTDSAEKDINQIEMISGGKVKEVKNNNHGRLSVRVELDPITQPRRRTIEITIRRDIGVRDVIWLERRNLV
jgi:hypothetical protein